MLCVTLIFCMLGLIQPILLCADFNTSDFESLKDNYNYIYKHNSSSSLQVRIPKIIHQIWLGSPLPKRFKKYQKSWLIHHPGWRYKLWTDADIKNFTWSNQKSKKLFDDAQNYGEKSDILRYELLYRYGGLYIDVDFECLKPFDNLHCCYDFYTGISNTASLELNNALIGSAAGHPIMKRCIEDLEDTGSKTDLMAIIERTGPLYFTRCFLNYAQEADKKMHEKIIAFPQSFFYPIPNTISKICTHDELEHWRQPESYAAHYWACSWQKPSAFISKKRNILS